MVGMDDGKMVVGGAPCGLLMKPNQALVFADIQNLVSFQDSGVVGRYSISY